MADREMVLREMALKVIPDDDSWIFEDTITNDGLDQADELVRAYVKGARKRESITEEEEKRCYAELDQAAKPESETTNAV